MNKMMQIIINVRKYINYAFFVMVIYCYSFHVFSQNLTPEYTEKRADVVKFIDELVETGKYDRKSVINILRKAKKIDKSITLISKSPENILYWRDYRKIFFSKARVQQGVEFLQRNKKYLQEIYQRYGVDPFVIVAIIGVETYYGKMKGNFKVLDVLATLGFDYSPRSRFFTKELKHFFLLVKDQRLDPHSVTGSYAGAMGIPQFMPSSYRLYSIDNDKNRPTDIWNSERDSIALVANYLKKNGWKKNNPIIFKAKVTGNNVKQILSENAKPKRYLKDIQQCGWSIDEKLSPLIKVSPMSFLGQNGEEYWVGFNNFRVITTYNRSNLYAMSVVEIANHIKKHINHRLI